MNVVAATIENARLLRLAGVLRLIPVSRSEWYRRVSTGEAPRPVALGPRARAWREREIHDYIQRLDTVPKRNAP